MARWELMPDFLLRAGLDVRSGGMACGEAGCGGAETVPSAVLGRLTTSFPSGSDCREDERLSDGTSGPASVLGTPFDSATAASSGVSWDGPTSGDATSAGVDGVSETQPPGRLGLVATVAG
jgi:hypothetical protein